MTDMLAEKTIAGPKFELPEMDQVYNYVSV